MSDLGPLPRSLQAAFAGAIFAAGVVLLCGAGPSLGWGWLVVAWPDPIPPDFLWIWRLTLVLAVVTLLLEIVTGAALILGGVMGLDGKPLGRTTTLVAFVLVLGGLIPEIGTVVCASWLTWESASGPSFLRHLAVQLATLGIGTVVTVTACWAVLKLVLVGMGIAPLLSPKARAFYAGGRPRR